MTTQLVEDPNFPYVFPYIHDFYQKHGAIPLPENEEEDGDEAIPVIVQIAFLEDEGFIIEEVEEETGDEKVANKVIEEKSVEVRMSMKGISKRTRPQKQRMPIRRILDKSSNNWNPSGCRKLEN
ncbi:hypothetical protein RHMOL_Rhmol01G0174100 [Rhododendron molle]|uniref:Uncharacterized protein n=1 Tax=Rhododendron molle TaxID=49168 RepID=A0ACC0Q4C8_RHOML|nr:hypothetical protein RHMOL_Rhmol01G0174100 [Rhododendron molle]